MFLKEYISMQGLVEVDLFQMDYTLFLTVNSDFPGVQNREQS